MCIFVYTLLGMNNVMTGYMRVSILVMLTICVCVHNLCDLVLVGLDSVSMSDRFYSDSIISEKLKLG